MEACSFQADPEQSEPAVSFCYHNLSNHIQSEINKTFLNEHINIFFHNTINKNK